MRNNNYNLVVLHHEEVFETRELALEYLDGYYKPFSLDGEPIVVKYGQANKPNIILAFGTSDATPGGYYAIDMTQAIEKIDEISEEASGNEEELEYVSEILDGVVKATGLTLDENKIEDKITYEPDSRDEVIGEAITIAEALDLLSKYAQREIANSKFSVEDTNSVELDLSEDDDEKVLKADVKVSTDGDSDDLTFNNNIIGVKPDGIYAASNLSYDDVRHQLIFTTSGYKNGRFQDDAIVQRVDLGEHTKLVADNEGKTVKVTVSENSGNYTTTLSADLQIADRENNILKASDGKVYVDGTAKNIKYGDTNVAAALNAHKNRLDELDTNVETAAKSAHIEGGQTDTLETVVSTLSDGGAKVTGNVRLGSTNSIVVRNGGLEANITVDVDAATNKLIVTIGNETIVKTLPGIELFESAEYNDENEELIITFRTGNTLVIPIHGIIHTWETVNSENSPVVLTKTVVTGGVDTLSGNIKLRSTDNLLGIENGRLYVSGQNIDNKIATETSRATDAENAIRTSIETLTNNVQSQFDSVSESITDVQDNLNEETTRAREAEAEIRAVANHADEVALEAKEGVNTLSGTVNELSTNLSTLETNVENLTEDVAEIAVLRGALNDEITSRTNKDTELEAAIAAANTAIETESSRAQTAEESINTRITHDISDVNTTIANEVTRATGAESALSTRIDELSQAIGQGSEQTLADAKAYTDAQVLAEKTAREAKDVELNNKIDTLETSVEHNIETAVRDAADDATAKADAAEQAANAYTDTAKEQANAYTDAQVLAEKNRAEAAETANADAIAAETARATAAETANADAIAAETARAEAAEADLTTEVNKKIETVQIVKNSQSDLQYILKVDGQDAGEINIPKDQFLRSASYDAGNKELIFVFETTQGTVTTNVSVADLVDTYTAGNGLTLANNEFSVRINEDSESYLTVSEEGIKLFGIDAKFAEAANTANAYTDAQVLAEKNRAEAAEAEITASNTTAIAAETARAEAAETANADAIAAETTRATAAETANADAIEILNGNEATEGSVKNAIKVSKDYTDAQVAVKANAADVYTKTEIDNKGFLTEHQDISNLATIASVEAVETMAQDNADAIEELESEVDDMKFITNETNTVRMTMVKETGAETRVLSSDVKLKTITGSESANIIKSDANGLYATVTFNYDKAANEITFNDGNGDKVYQLNNFGILQDAIYDSENKSIVLIIKKDDETTERITIPVSDLVNTWTVENPVNSPIVLTKTETENGDVLSADVSILNNGHNLLSNENGSLFVDADCNQHIALWGNEVTNVQGVINILKERTDDIEEMKQDIEDLQDDNENIKIVLAEYQTDLTNQKERITNNENNIITLFEKTHNLEVQVAVLTERIDILDEKVTEVYDRATEALTKVETLIENIGDGSELLERIERIENVLEQLIDFGEYDIQL